MQRVKLASCEYETVSERAFSITVETETSSFVKTSMAGEKASCVMRLNKEVNEANI